jgi:hypothetical protein
MIGSPTKVQNLRICGPFRASRPKPFANTAANLHSGRTNCVRVDAIRRDAELNPRDAGVTHRSLNFPRNP